MQTLLSKNPFQTTPTGLDSLIQDNLGQAKLLGQSAWNTFSEIANRAVPAQQAQAPQQEQGLVEASFGSYGDGKPTQFSDRFAEYGFADNVPRSLIGTESGGNFDAENAEAGSGGNGHFGILQFGHGRLDDAKRAGVIPESMTPQQFKKSRKAQVAVSNWHFSDIDKRVKQQGFDKLIGQNVGGTPITANGMRAIAHLGGFGGLQKFISTGGRYNPSDSFGTSLSAYGRKHAS